MGNTDPRIAEQIGEPTGWVAIDLSADQNAPAGQRGIWVGVAGDIKIDDMQGNLGTVIHNVPVGLWPFPCKMIYSTAHGTTASLLTWAYA